MDELGSFGAIVVVHADRVISGNDFFHRDDSVGAGRQGCAGGDAPGGLRVGKRPGRLAGALHAFEPEFSLSGSPRFPAQRDTVHGGAVVRRKVTFGKYVLAQDAAGCGRQRHPFGRPCRDGLQDEPFSLGDGELGLHRWLG